MRISTTACHALQLLICLTEHRHQPPLSAAELATLTLIPDKFARKILRSLHKAGIVRGHRGIAGGYTLEALPKDISLACIIKAVEGGIAPPGQAPEGMGGLLANTAWTTAALALEEALGACSLQSIMDSAAAQDSLHIQSSSQAHSTSDVQQGECEAQSATTKAGLNHAKAPSLGRQRSRNSFHSS